MKRFCMLTGIVLAWSISATAQDGDKGTGLFKQLDKNSDGKLVADEISKEQARFFERLIRIGDADKNGELTESEFIKATSQTSDAPPVAGNGAVRRPGNPGGQPFDAATLLKRLDRNGDGKLEKGELPEQFAERLAPAFEKLGKDALTLQEFQQLRQNMERAGAGLPGQRPGQMGNPEETFKRLDANGDGKLTVDEAPEQGRRMVAAILERSGKGRDGSLTMQEFQSAVAQFNRAQPNGRPDGGDKRPESDRPARDGEMRRPEDGARPANGGPAFLRILDTNHDGRLTRDELSKAASLLERLDQNGDGALDGRELFGPPPSSQGAMERPRPSGDRDSSVRPRRPASDQPEGKPDASQASPQNQADRDRRPKLENPEEFLSRQDRDKDGAISKDEAPDRLKQNFDRVDSNKDGKVTLDELRKSLSRFGKN
jgi:Ca2+-binding EF-hand superfamily protein